VGCGEKMTRKPRTVRLDMDGEAHAFDSLTDRRSVEVLPNSLTLKQM